MSCLYSSPEVANLGVISPGVISLGVIRLEVTNPGIVVVIVASSDAARVTRTESVCSSIPDRFCRTSRSTKTRSPAVQRDAAGCTKSFSLPKQAQVSRVSFQAQYQAFVRFAVGSSAAF
jgi:hypothetical protein